MNTGPVLVDVQATQSASHRDRGVARYTAELAAALWRGSRELVHSFLLNPDLAPPGAIEPLVASGRVAYSDRGDFTAARLLHVCSPIELDVPIGRLWPAAAAGRGLRLVVTLYDLIPEIFADRYLQDPGLRRRYRARLELVRAADLVLAISEQTARDAVERLGLHPDRVVVVGAAASERLRAARVARRRARRRARGGSGTRSAVRAVHGGDGRPEELPRPVPRLGRLPAAVRDAWQLVMVCGMDDPTRNHLVHLARGVGIESRLLLTGYVPDAVLRLLYQSTDLFVFPSLYEGYGLPVAEAMASGARVIGSATSSVGELLVPEAQFDPARDDAIAGAIERALTSEPTRAVLDEQSRRPLPDWDAVGTQVADAYRELLDRPHPAARRRPRVAFVTPLPPAPTGIADFSYRLLAELRAHCDVHAFADGERHVDPDLGPPRAPDGVDVRPARFLGEHERALGGFDCVVYCLGNSEFHGYALAQLRRRSGVVLAHEVRLTDLYALTADIPGAVPGGPPERVSAEDAERNGVLMAAEIVELSDCFVVMSQYAAARVRLDLDPVLADRVAVLPFAGRDVVARPTPNEARGPIVASFGIVNEVKQNTLLVRALAAVAARVPDVSAALVGPCADAEREHLTELAAELGVADRVTITGAVPDAEYDAWLDRAASRRAAAPRREW